MKHSIKVVVAAGLGLTLSSMALNAKDDQGLPTAPLDIAGVWLAGQPAIPNVYTQPLITTTTITPTDPSGHRFAYVASGINGDPAFMGLFPDATQVATQIGTIERTGPRNFRITAVQYFWKPPGPGNENFGSWDRGQVLYFFVMSGTITLPDANTMVSNGSMAFYSRTVRGPVNHWLFNLWGITELHNQDKDNDGLPDVGEQPFMCLPIENEVMKRLPVLAPCSPVGP